MWDHQEKMIAVLGLAFVCAVQYAANLRCTLKDPRTLLQARMYPRKNQPEWRSCLVEYCCT